MESQEIKNIYFGFYDQLIEPYCSQAKRNYDGCKSEPQSLLDAILLGFIWGDSAEGRDYWDKFHNNIHNYLKSELSGNNSDMVNHPQHYGGDTTYEYFKVAEAWGWHKRAYLWNAGKYMCRTGKKSKENEIEDLEKAIVYLNKEIELLKNGN
jgi:Protein of unknwon function (DUF3310)